MTRCKRLTSTGCCAAHVSEEIRVGIPKYAVEAEHNLVEIPEPKSSNGLLLPVR